MPRKVSLKEIVKAIDHAIHELEEETENQRGKETTDERMERAKVSLKGIRETVVGICLPGFEIP